MSTWAPAGATDGDAHLVVAAEAVELIQLIGRVARSGAHLVGQGLGVVWLSMVLWYLWYDMYSYGMEWFTTSLAVAVSSSLQPVQEKW